MQRKPPMFDTWIEFYDYINKTKPELLLVKSFIIVTPKHVGNTVQSKQRKIYTHTLMKNCWQEAQKVRLDKDKTMQALSAIYRANDATDWFNVLDFLKTMEIKSNV